MNGLTRCVTAAALCAVLMSPAFSAEDVTVEGTLQSLKGKRATLKLQSGQELTGVVTVVANGTVKLTELTGMDFFDAVVRMERIDAVVMRRVTQ
jgi:hypothetical protein